MLTFCILCTHLIPEDRQLRGACTCSTICQKDLRKARLKYTKERNRNKICRLCEGHKVFERDGHKCVFCGSTENLTIDHIKPKARGGLDDFNNLQTLCQGCNSKKGSKYPHKPAEHGSQAAASADETADSKDCVGK